MCDQYSEVVRHLAPSPVRYQRYVSQCVPLCPKQLINNLGQSECIWCECGHAASKLWTHFSLLGFEHLPIKLKSKPYYFFSSDSDSVMSYSQFSTLKANMSFVCHTQGILFVPKILTFLDVSMLIMYCCNNVILTLKHNKLATSA